MRTILEPDSLYPDTALERRIVGEGVRLLQGNAKKSLLELPDDPCARVDGLMRLCLAVPAGHVPQSSPTRR